MSEVLNAAITVADLNVGALCNVIDDDRSLFTLDLAWSIRVADFRVSKRYVELRILEDRTAMSIDT